jgi:hypothetical protein
LATNEEPVDRLTNYRVTKLVRHHLQQRLDASGFWSLFPCTVSTPALACFCVAAQFTISNFALSALVISGEIWVVARHPRLVAAAEKYLKPMLV